MIFSMAPTRLESKERAGLIGDGETEEEEEKRWRGRGEVAEAVLGEHFIAQQCGRRREGGSERERLLLA